MYHSTRNTTPTYCRSISVHNCISRRHFQSPCCTRTSVTLRARTISNFYSCLNKLYDMYNTYTKHVVYLHRRICMPNLFYLLWTNLISCKCLSLINIYSLASIVINRFFFSEWELTAFVYLWLWLKTSLPKN